MSREGGGRGAAGVSVSVTASKEDNTLTLSRACLAQPQDHMSKFSDLDYCKTDLIASKGVVFCKFHKSSAALSAMEEISEGGNVRSRGAEGRGQRGSWEGAARGWIHTCLDWPPKPGSLCPPPRHAAGWIQGQVHAGGAQDEAACGRVTDGHFRPPQRPGG